MAAEQNSTTTPLSGWRSWCVAAFMWLACRFVPAGYVIEFDLVEEKQR